MADLTKREDNLKALVVNPGHGDIKPVTSKRRFIVMNLSYYFPTQDSGMSYVCAKPGTSLFFAGQ